jgi:hypothetical protein
MFEISVQELPQLVNSRVLSIGFSNVRFHLYNSVSIK